MNSSNNGTTVLNGKHPTRLQKQAPATLRLDDQNHHQIPNNLSKTVIPFLSPLVLSPSPDPLPEVSCDDDEKRNSFVTPNTNNNHAIGIIPQISAGPGGGGGGDSGWKHPAMAGGPIMADSSSSLYAYFHSQCTILPRNQ